MPGAAWSRGRPVWRKIAGRAGRTPTSGTRPAPPGGDAYRGRTQPCAASGTRASRAQRGGPAVSWSSPSGGARTPAAAEVAPGEATRWAAVLSLMGAGVAAPAQVGKGAAALPVLQAEFGLSTSAAAWYLSAMSALGAVAGALLGWMGQALGFRRQVLLGLLTITTANVARAVPRTAAPLLATRVGEG